MGEPIDEALQTNPAYCTSAVNILTGSGLENSTVQVTFTTQLINVLIWLWALTMIILSQPNLLLPTVPTMKPLMNNYVIPLWNMRCRGIVGS